MIERLSGHRAFVQLRQEGERRGRGPLRLVSRLDAAQNARIAFAVPRSVGNAVARNRIRRRLRAVLQEIASVDGDLLSRGDHLIRVTAPIDHWSHAKLRNTMTDLLTAESTP